jgi:hypothetical protein
MTDQELINLIMATAHIQGPKLIGIEVAHDPDCPRLFGKECTCNPDIKAKEIDD